MKCQVCKINERKKNSVICSDKCDVIRLDIIRLANKYTPTVGCENCWGDLGQGCTEKCKDEFKKSNEFVGEIYRLVRVSLSVADIQERIIKLNDEINNWTKERWEAKEQGYINHCCGMISSLVGERNALKWVMGEQHYA